MLILVLIDVQYSQKAVFSFEKGSNHQNQSSSGSLYLVNTPPPPSKISNPPPTEGGGGIHLPTPYDYLQNPGGICCQSIMKSKTLRLKVMSCHNEPYQQKG